MEGKTFVGCGCGRFKTDDGQMRDYCSVFVSKNFTGAESNEYHLGGQKAVKYGCTSPDVWKDVKPGTRVQCYFDSHKKIRYMSMVPVKS